MADVIRSAAPKADMIIDQGATFDIMLTWADERQDLIPLTGWTAALQVRSTTDATDVLLDMTTENDRIVLGGDAGTIRLILTKDETAALSFESGLYQLELYSPLPEQNTKRILKGNFIIDSEIVRP